MNKHISRSRIKKLQKELKALNDERTEMIFALLHGKPMIHGLPREVFRKCGKVNCRCLQGPPHGPYPAIAINRQGKQKIVMIKKDDPASVLSQAARYRHFQKTMAGIRKTNKKIDSLLESIKSSSTSDFYAR